jgi:hypothetical protein
MRNAIRVAAAVILALVITAGWWLWRAAPIATAFYAKTLCSGVFVSGRDPASLLSQELSPDDIPELRPVRAEVDRERRRVIARFAGLAERVAQFRPGLGCTVLIDTSALPPAPQQSALVPVSWPMNDAAAAGNPSRVDVARLQRAVNAAFGEPQPQRPRRTRAVVVVHHDRIVAERYAEGFPAHTPLIGWSMTKSALNALVGILVREGRLDLSAPVRLPEWRGDGRAAITADHLLHMTSGLEFSENYSNPLDDVIFMLLGTPDMAAFAAAKPLALVPGSRWRYSSGTSNILAHVARDAIGSSTAYLTFPRRALFDKLGMASATIEPDASGTWVGSSYMYATARDWARFGLLYLHDGVWRGERVLPRGWVQYSVTPAPGAPDGKFGAHWWLKVPFPFNSPDASRPVLPPDAFHAVGHEGQFVSIVPSRDLVVVRLGLSRADRSWDHEAFLADILAAVPPSNGARRK